MSWRIELKGKEKEEEGKKWQNHHHHHKFLSFHSE
jgi:hypothetical protein